MAGAGPEEGVLVNSLMEYTEEGGVTLVEVLEDASDDQWFRYKLKAVRTLAESRIVNDIPAGEVFDVMKKRDSGCEYLMWQLEPTEATP